MEETLAVWHGCENLAQRRGGFVDGYTNNLSKSFVWWARASKSPNRRICICEGKEAEIVESLPPTVIPLRHHVFARTYKWHQECGNIHLMQ